MEIVRTDSRVRTIHGMVYNAMKLFMEINPQLFDDCSHEYTEQQNNAAAREAEREMKWAALTKQAEIRRRANGAASSSLASVDEEDAADDNQKRLDSLNLKDGRSSHEQQHGSVGSNRSHR